MHLKHISLLMVLQEHAGQVLAQIDLGTAVPFGIVASSAITNTGATIVTGSLGLSPNTKDSITGFPPGLSGVVNAGDEVADQARQDARTAYNMAGSLEPTSQIAGADLGGQTLVAGVYTSPSSVSLTGILTLDGQNDPNSQFVFQIGSTLTTASSASIVLINGARACNVNFQVGSSATLGSSTRFNGNVIALTSITLLDDVIVNGGLYALNGAVTLINDRIVPQQECVAVTSSTVLTDPSTIISQSSTETSSAVQVSVSGDASTESFVTVTSPPSSATVTLLPSSTATTAAPSQPNQSDQPDTTTIEPMPSRTQSSTPDILIHPTSVSLPGPIASTTSSLPSVVRTTTSLSEIPMSGSSTPIIPATTSRVPITVSLSTFQITTTTTFSKRSRVGSLSTESFTKVSTLFNATSTTRSSKASRYATFSTRNPRTSRTHQSTRPFSSFTPMATGESKSYHVYTSNKPHNHTTNASSSSGPTWNASTHQPYAAAKTTHIRGTPCTTITYYEPSCACTQTTIVPIAYTPGATTPSPAFTPATVTTVSGTACTTTSYYEQSCDCVLGTYVPLMAVTDEASIHTVISDVPYITLKRYEPACSCVRTATVPVRVASGMKVAESAIDCTTPPNTL